jgi:beta-barrel assembly-enhancing protease
MKALFKGISIIGAFLGLWLLLAQIDFVGFFKIDRAASTTEKRVGDAIWDEIKKTEDIIVSDSITKKLDRLLKSLCEENNIEQNDLKVHIIKNNEVNAFALPDGHLVVYSGLINDSKNEQALIGVLGHEIAHIEKNHVMKKLSKEIGLSVLLSLTTGNNNASAIRSVFKTLSSSAYDRSLEREADLSSVEYMLNAKINPAPFADFLYQMSFESNIQKNAVWISSHPESEERAKYVLEYIKGKKFDMKTILTQKEWNDFKGLVNNYE